jgi:hypothetical protein
MGTISQPGGSQIKDVEMIPDISTAPAKQSNIVPSPVKPEFNMNMKNLNKIQTIPPWSAPESKR